MKLKPMKFSTTETRPTMTRLFLKNTLSVCEMSYQPTTERRRLQTANNRHKIISAQLNKQTRRSNVVGFLETGSSILVFFSSNAKISINKHYETFCSDLLVIFNESNTCTYKQNRRLELTVIHCKFGVQICYESSAYF